MPEVRTRRTELTKAVMKATGLMLDGKGRDGLLVLADFAQALDRENAELREVLVKIRAHTGHTQSADRELLAGLLESITRITDEALSRTDPVRTTEVADADWAAHEYEIPPKTEETS